MAGGAEDRAAKLIEAGMALASELSLPALLQRIVELAAEITGARYGALGVVGPAGGTVFGNIYRTEKQESDEFTAEDEEAVVVLAAQAGIAIENARLYEDTHHKQQRLEAVREITDAIVGGTDPTDVLQLVAGRAR